MVKKALTVSIVIPVYNEESYIGACLDAIAAQTVKPNEVIIVDNNCTDDTMEIVQDYTFVSILSEPRQGQVFAQAKGFDRAKSDILARIDADTQLPPDWVQHVIAGFKADHDVQAITGSGLPYDVPLKKVGKAVFNFYHNFISRLFSGRTMLWGANYAIRAATWNSVKSQLHYRADIWEDYDLSFQLGPRDIKHLASLEVACSFRAAHKSIPEQFRYQLRCVRTFVLNRGVFMAIIFGVCWYSMLILTPAALLDRYLWLLKSRSH